GGDEFNIDTVNVLKSDEAGLYSACDALIGVLVAQTKYEDALATTDRCRSRSLVERLAGRVSAVDTGRPIVTADVAPLSVAELKQVARDRQATIISYWIKSDRQPFQVSEREKDVLIWAIQPNGTVTFHRSSIASAFEQAPSSSPSSDGGRGPSIETYLLESRSDLGIAPRGVRIDKVNFRRADKLNRLHRLLIEPIANTLPQDPEALTIVIPHRSLYAVPFAALRDARGNYVIDNHTVITAPSIQALVYTQRRGQQIRQRPNTGEAIVVGNPTMPPFGEPPRPLEPLPGAEAEAKEVANLLGVPPLIGASATESAIAPRLVNAPLIHFATHGLLDTIEVPLPELKLIGLLNLDPETTASKAFRSPGLIALAPSGMEDGYLESAEISQLGLNANLVVLSACNTSRGLSLGEGVVGLQRAFFAAGVPTIVGSLWYVPDEPTSKLMVEFYRNLDRGLSKAQALRQAMLAVKSTDPQPFSWAGFQLAGEPD
ncbi:MAG: CHAT domain-containing protein, partial [Cyanobacteria bacterium J06641_5]